MKETLVKTHCFVFNKQDNGGEAFDLTTKFYVNNDGDVYWIQEFTLASYGNSASLELSGNVLTPKLIRDLANQLDSLEIEATSINQDKKPDALLKSHSFYFDTNDGNKKLALITKLISNGDDGAEGIYWNQELNLCTNCNVASFELCGASLMPENLRDLANQLEKVDIEVNLLVKENKNVS